tara:strand:- start:19 stop:618 length:600 start_codon:yes stop_codon:yes gene_type:complete
MSWFTIIKNPKLRAGSKVTTNLSSTSGNQPDEPCKKKLLEYREKLKKIKGLLTNLGIENPFEEREGERESKFGGTIKEEVDYYIHGTEGEEESFSALPEDVACKALKMLSGISGDSTTINKQIGDNYWCEVTRTITSKDRVYGLDDMKYLVFTIALTIMVDNGDGPVVFSPAHRILLPFDEVRGNIKDYNLLLDKMDWR